MPPIFCWIYLPKTWSSKTSTLKAAPPCDPWNLSSAPPPNSPRRLLRLRSPERFGTGNGNCPHFKGIFPLQQQFKGYCRHMSPRLITRGFSRVFCEMHSKAKHLALGNDFNPTRFCSLILWTLWFLIGLARTRLRIPWPSTYVGGSDHGSMVCNPIFFGG